jgi:hypothetical protein
MDIECSDVYQKFFVQNFGFSKMYFLSDLKCIFIIGVFAPMSQNTMSEEWLTYMILGSRNPPYLVSNA